MPLNLTKFQFYGIIYIEIELEGKKRCHHVEFVIIQLI